VLDDELVSIVQFVHGDGERELPLSQREVLVDLRIRISLSHNMLKREERKKIKEKITSSCSWKSSTSHKSLKNLVILSLLSSTKPFRGIINCSFA